ncbi:DegV family protein [Speluncibacter jeojiensis]|uniref:DegV family protein n=1 Tax=Speluncibacter jeojiensis TaxID=2710754 RepID=A0A9X4LVX5_9ACTN|nr:DegV family protein [Corynebacteriales bacterium D3-21]
MAVIVVTDSNAHVPSALVAELGIQVVPLHMLLDDTDLREGIDQVPDEIAKTSVVTTAGASPGELKQSYFDALKASGGDGVLAVHISRQLSGTWDAGRQAALEFESRVRIVDSGSAGMGTGFPVLAAARAAAAGADLDEVFRIANDTVERSNSLLYVDRLENLRRGGRIGAAAAFLGTALSMRPILQMVNGKLLLREKTRTASKAMTKLVELVVEGVGGGPAAVAVQHWQASERATELGDQLRERIPEITEMHMGEYGPVLGAHLGPGAVGVTIVPGGAGTAG